MNSYFLNFCLFVSPGEYESITQASLFHDFTDSFSGGW